MMKKELEFEQWIDQCIKDAKLKLAVDNFNVSLVLLRALTKELLEIYWKDKPK